MIQPFIKNDIIRSFLVENNKVYTTIEIDDRKVTNPTLEQFLSIGWEYYIAPEPKPYIPTYAELVEQYIREHGYETYGSEIAVINNYMENPEDPKYTQEYNNYMSVRRDAKEWANKQHKVS